MGNGCQTLIIITIIIITIIIIIIIIIIILDKYKNIRDQIQPHLIKYTVEIFSLEVIVKSERDP